MPMDITQSTSTSPQQGQGPDRILPARKRRRPALSCEQCRKRKVKCDRNFPFCDRCARSGQAHACAYSDDIFSRADRDEPTRRHRRAKYNHRPAQSNRSSSPKRCARTSSIYRPIQGIIDPVTTENHVQAIPAAEDSILERHSHPPAAVAENISPHTGGFIYLKGKDSQTRFFGQTNPMNMYSQVPLPCPQCTRSIYSQQQFEGLRAYIQDVKSENPRINKLRAEVEASKRDGKDINIIEGPCLDSLLPPRQAVDELVAVYLNSFERTHRILHVPSFRKEYARYWGSPQSAASGFVAQLLTMMAVVLVLDNRSTVEPLCEKPATRETALEWVDAAESFLQRRTKRPDLRIFQIYCLTIVARRVNGFSANQAWIATGNLVKLAMSAGYHREPNSGGNVSPFYAEMRRRIWTTIVEFDVQASVDRGMPPSVREGDFKIIRPLNISDHAIDESSSDLPASEPLEMFTDSVFQAVLTESLMLRLRICAWVNSANVGLDYEDVLNMDEELSRHLNRIPPWSRPTADAASSQQRSRTRVLLGLALRQYVILLHSPFAPLGQHTPKYAHSRRARHEAATTILCQFQDIMEPGTSNLIPCFMPSDALRAALTVCHELYMSDTGYGTQLIDPAWNHPGSSIIGSSPILRVVPNIAESLISLAEKVLDAIEIQVYKTGKKMPELYLLGMILSLMKARLWPAEAQASRTKAAEQLLRAGYRFTTGNTQGEAKSPRRSMPQGVAMPTPGYDATDAVAASPVPQQWLTDDFQINESFDIAEDIEAEIFGVWNVEDLFDF